MSVSPTKFFVTSLILGGLAFPVHAQADDLSPNRDASFLTDGAAVESSSSTPVFSGLAATPPELMPPPMAEPVAAVLSSALTVVPGNKPATPAPPPAAAPAPAAQAPATPTPAAPAPVPVPTPVASSALPPPPPPAPVPAVSEPPAPATPTAVALNAADNLGATMWKGTSRPTAERLLSLAVPTSSPVLNGLMQRLLTTTATPPDNGAGDDSDTIQSLTSQRVEKLVTFASAPAAWTLAAQADPKRIDDITFHFAAEAALADGSLDVCAAVPTAAKERNGVDWQKALAICQLRAKDVKNAGDTLNFMRTQPGRDDIFLEVADKDVLATGKSLPYQLTPLTPALLALLRLTNMPLPGELYGHPDFALIPALLRAPARQDVAQLALAERAAERGAISSADLGAIYRTVSFAPGELAAPLTATVSGSRQHALLYQAASAEKDPSRRMTLAVKFMQAAQPTFLNGAGAAAADMMGTITADEADAGNALAVAQIYMLAGRGDLALSWLRLARRNPPATNDLQNLWPQFTLAGLELEGDYTGDLAAWLDAALKPANAQADMRVARDNAATALLMLDAAGFTIPDAAWAKVLATTKNEKRIALSPVLLTRLQAASAGNRRAETVLLAVAVAGDGDISLPEAMAITRALRNVGLKTEAATFARQTVALQMQAR